MPEQESREELIERFAEAIPGFRWDSYLGEDILELLRELMAENAALREGACWECALEASYQKPLGTGSISSDVAGLCVFHAKSVYADRNDFDRENAALQQKWRSAAEEIRRIYEEDGPSSSLLRVNAAQAALLREARLAIWSFIDPPHLTQEEIWGVLTKLDAALKEPQA